MKYIIAHKNYFEPSFSFKKIKLYTPTNLAKNKLLKIKRIIYKQIFEIIKFITDKMIQRERFAIDNKKKILKLMDIHEDVDLSTLSKYYTREFAKYKQILSLGIKKSISYNQPYYNNLFNNNMKPKTKTTDFALNFFKNPQEN